jgi:CheY-like chemotaxis protein
MESILIIDDEKELREGSAELLRMEGYYVETAADGDEALLKFKQHPYELALVDLVLPGAMNGLDIISKIRPLSKKTHIIAFTGFSGQNLSEKATRAGADAFVTKPCLANNLLETVNTVFKKPPKKTPNTLLSTPESHNGNGHSNGNGAHNGNGNGFKSADTNGNGNGNAHSTATKPFAPNLFLNMPSHHITGLINLGEEKVLPPGRFFKLQTNENLAIVKHGWARCWFENCMVGTLVSGESLGESTLFLEQSPLAIYLESDAEMTLLVLSKEKIRNYFAGNKALITRFAVNTVNSLARKLAVSYDYITQLADSKNSKTTDEIQII